MREIIEKMMSKQKERGFYCSLRCLFGFRVCFGRESINTQRSKDLKVVNLTLNSRSPR